jgi:hypothetical protein
MNRRTFLRTSAGLTGGVALAGCAGLFSVQQGDPPVLENRPSAVYYPTHTEGMEMLGMSGMDGMNTNASDTGGTTDSGGTGMNGSSGMNGSDGMDMNDSAGGGRGGASDYAFGLMYSHPHRFWTITGSQTQKTSVQEEDSVHLMASVWEPKTGTVLPDTGLSVEINQGDTLVSQETIYPMLSQPMGFHYGANFALDGEGTYTATLSVGGMSTRRTGTFVGLFDEPASVDIEFEYSQQAIAEIAYNRTGQRAGNRAAAAPMNMEMLPNSMLPKRGKLPGEVVGTRSSGDGRFVLTVLDEPPQGISASGSYLAVSARTPYNRMVLPAMALSGTLRRNGQTVFDGSLQPTLDSALDYHYGATIDSIESGDELSIAVETPPQVARHEGYETAFLDMSPMNVTL